MYVNMCSICALRVQKGMFDPLELELEMAVGHLYGLFPVILIFLYSCSHLPHRATYIHYFLTLLLR